MLAPEAASHSFSAHFAAHRTCFTPNLLYALLGFCPKEPYSKALLHSKTAPNLLLLSLAPVLRLAACCIVHTYSCAYLLLYSVDSEGRLSFSFTLALLLLCSHYSLCVN